jgi:L-iditol 2-dehydrogenase
VRRNSEELATISAAKKSKSKFIISALEDYNTISGQAAKKSMKAKQDMMAAYLDAPGKIGLRRVEMPQPGPGEVRIRLQQVGVCGSDVHLFAGHRELDYPFIIGHEGLGIIDKLGAGVEKTRLAERVVIEPNFSCGTCQYCRGGHGNICINKGVLGINLSGCFAEYICVPADFAWPLPEDIDDQDAVLIEPMAVAYHALFAAKSRPGDTIAVIGLGAIGLLLTHLGLNLGYRVVVSEINTDKRKMAAAMGAIPLEAEGDLEQQVKQLSKVWQEHKVSAVFECAGSAFTASLATAAAPRGSEIVLVGLSGKQATFQPLKIAREQITIVPSIIYDHPFDFRRVIQLIQSKTISPNFVISEYVPLQKLQTALETAASGTATKIIITI